MNDLLLGLDDQRWLELQHAYGPASDIPALLQQLKTFPDSEGTSEPWFSLWSALAHQGDVYAASFAAVPHVVKLLESAPERAPWVFFQFPLWVEICRVKKDVAVPGELNDAYCNAIEKLPQIVCAVLARDWDPNFAPIALAAIAVGKRLPQMAEVILELTPDILPDTLMWMQSR